MRALPRWVVMGAAAGLLALALIVGGSAVVDAAPEPLRMRNPGEVTTGSNATLGNVTVGSLSGSAIYGANFYQLNSAAASLNGQVADGAAAIGVKLGNTASLTNATAEAVRIYSDANTTPRAAFMASGALRLVGVATGTLPTCSASHAGSLQYDTTTKRTVRCDGTEWRTVHDGFSLKATDTSNSTTSFADVTGLTWAAAASTTYTFRCYLIYQAAATTTGVMFGVNGPASPTLVDYRVEIQTAANQGAAALSTVAQDWGHAVAYQTAFTATAGVVAANTNYYATIEGTVINGSTSGTIAIQEKSEVAAATTVKAGSWCSVL